MLEPVPRHGQQEPGRPASSARQPGMTCRCLRLRPRAARIPGCVQGRGAVLRAANQYRRVREELRHQQRRRTGRAASCTCASQVARGNFTGGAQVYVIDRQRSSSAARTPTSPSDQQLARVHGRPRQPDDARTRGYDPAKVIVLGVQLNTGAMARRRERGDVQHRQLLDRFARQHGAGGTGGGGGTAGTSGGGGAAGAAGTAGAGGSGDSAAATSAGPRPLSLTLSRKRGEGIRRGDDAYFFLALPAGLGATFSSRYAATQNSGAFQLIVTSLADQASPLSRKHFCGGQPSSPADGM